MSEAANETFSKPDPKVAVRKETKKLLVGIGFVLVVLAIAVAALNWAIGSKTTETEPAKSASDTGKVEKTKETFAGPSDELLTAVIGSGAALILIGFLYGRISSIKLPGGIDVGLTADEVEKGTKKTLEALPDGVDPATAAKAIQQTQEAMLTVKAGQQAEAGVAPLPDEKIRSVAESAVEAVSAG